MLVAQNSLGPVCPVPLTVRGNVDALKAKELDRLSKPWTWPDIEELELKYGCIQGYTTAKQNAAVGLCRW